MLAVFGSSILTQNFLDNVTVPKINLHAGLSPYYRGTASNFWALHDGMPECMGMTIHHIDGGIDTGPVIHQDRPQNLNIGDDYYNATTKTISSGFDALIHLLSSEQIYSEGMKLNNLSGQLRMKSDFGEAPLKKMLDNFDNGILTTWRTSARAISLRRLLMKNGGS